MGQGNCALIMKNKLKEESSIYFISTTLQKQIGVKMYTVSTLSLVKAPNEKEAIDFVKQDENGKVKPYIDDGYTDIHFAMGFGSKKLREFIKLLKED